jgi:hypothetical protein
MNLVTNALILTNQIAVNVLEYGTRDKLWKSEIMSITWKVKLPDVSFN